MNQSCVQREASMQPLDFSTNKLSKQSFVEVPNTPVATIVVNPVATEIKKSKFNWWWLLLLPIGYKILK